MAVAWEQFTTKHIVHYPEERRANRNARARTRACVRAGMYTRTCAREKLVGNGDREGWTDRWRRGRSACISTHMHAATHTCTRTRTRERAGGQRGGRGGGEGSREEGFITRDLLLLPGGGKPLQRATAMHTYARRGETHRARPVS